MRFLDKGNGVIDRVRIKLFFILICGLFTSAFNYEWNIKLVDGTGSQFNSIDIDSLGRPHIAYFTGWQQPALKYAYKNDTNWYIGTIAESCGLWLSLKLDQNGQPKISNTSYAGYLFGKLLYSYLQNDTWCHIIIDTLQTCKYSSLALDSMENPCISYLSGEWQFGETLKVKYAHLNDSIWDFQLVDTCPPYVGGSFEFKTTGIALDDTHKPHIAYGYDGADHVSDVGFAGARYAYFDYFWNVENIHYNSGFWINFRFEKICLKLDRLGRPHIVLSFSGQNLFVFYKYWLPVSGWQSIRLPDSLATTASFDIDSLNQIHIAYISDNKLMYAIWDGNTWTFDTITTGNFSGDVSLKLDQDDNPHICFFTNRLYYVYGSPTGIEEIKNQNAISLMAGVYPNPAKGVLRVRVPFFEKSIKIFDSSGRLIKEIATPSARNDEVVEITLKGINSGIYFMRLDKETKKFLVVK